MADGWRNRFWAPVYALGISFLLVFSLGFALDDSTWIRFQSAAQSGSSERLEVFRDYNVRVDTYDGKQKLADERLGRSPEFKLRTPDERIKICMVLPADWSAADPKADWNYGQTCWDRDAWGKPVVIELKRKG